MRAILNKTVGPNFRAGDVIKGDYARIKRLIDTGVATSDHSMMGMFGCFLTWIIWSLILIFTISTFWEHQIDGNKVYLLSPYWRWTFIVMGIYIIIKTTMHFFNPKNPYSTYFLSFSTTIIGGIFIMAGHEKATSRYQARRTSATAAIILYSTASIATAIAILSFWNWNKIDNANGAMVNASVTMKHIFTWLLYVTLMVFGWAAGKYFDKDYKHRRKRFIGFLVRKNVSVEYKTKALTHWRAYKATGNADQFMAKNIDLLEESLEVDRNQLLGPDKTKK